MRVYYRLLSSGAKGYVDLKAGCDGYFTGSVPDTKGEQVKLVVDLSAGSGKWDAKGSDGYRASGSAVTLNASTGGQWGGAHGCQVSTEFAISGSGVSGGKLSLAKGKSAQLTATVSPSNAAIATVTGSGYVSAVKAGTAKRTEAISRLFPGHCPIRARSSSQPGVAATLVLPPSTRP